MKIADGRRKGKLGWKIVVLGLASLATIGMHPYYVSVTDVEVFPADELLGITIKVFTDDLEDVLRQRGTERLSLGAEAEHQHADQYIARYLDEVIRWSINGQARTAGFLGKEVEEGTTYLYLEITQNEQVDSLVVSHRLFLDELETQQNIIHLHCEGGITSKRLNVRSYSTTLMCD